MKVWVKSCIKKNYSQTGQDRTWQSRTAHSTAQHSAAHTLVSTVQYRTEQNRAQHSTAQHSTAEYTRIEYSSEQFRTVQYSPSYHISTARKHVISYNIEAGQYLQRIQSMIQAVASYELKMTEREEDVFKDDARRLFCYNCYIY